MKLRIEIDNEMDPRYQRRTVLEQHVPHSDMTTYEAIDILRDMARAIMLAQGWPDCPDSWGAVSEEGEWLASGEDAS